MITVDRDIYLVVLGSGIGFLSSVGGAITKYLLDIRLDKIKRGRDEIYQEAHTLREQLLGNDDPELKRRLLYGNR